MKTIVSQKFSLPFASDLVLWMGVVIVFLGLVYWLGKPSNFHCHRFTLLFDNVNQITEGSPVRLMGSEIGYVDAVIPKKDRAQINIVTDENAPPLPENTIATISFNGLAGAKVIELMPMDPQQKPLPSGLCSVLKSEEPIRISDIFQAQLTVGRSLYEAATALSQTIAEHEADVPISQKLANIAGELKQFRDEIQQEKKWDKQFERLVSGYLKQAQQVIRSVSSFLKTHVDSGQLNPNMAVITNTKQMTEVLSKGFRETQILLQSPSVFRLNNTVLRPDMVQPVMFRTISGLDRFSTLLGTWNPVLEKQVSNPQQVRSVIQTLSVKTPQVNQKLKQLNQLLPP